MVVRYKNLLNKQYGQYLGCWKFSDFSGTLWKFIGFFNSAPIYKWVNVQFCTQFRCLFVWSTAKHNDFKVHWFQKMEVSDQNLVSPLSITS